MYILHNLFKIIEINITNNLCIPFGTFTDVAMSVSLSHGDIMTQDF